MSFNNNGVPLTGDKTVPLSKFRDLVTYSSFKVSNYFYRVNQVFGAQQYFAILPLKQQSEQLGTIVIELKTKPSQPPGSFPDLLKDESLKQDNRFDGYSFAFLYP